MPLNQEIEKHTINNLKHKKGMPIRKHKAQRRRYFIGVFLTFIASLFSPAQGGEEIFTHHGKISSSWQFDVDIDSHGILHLIGDQYYQFDLNGKMLTAESQAQDLQQYSLSYPPAIALDPAGNAHMLLRGIGSFSSGFDITYKVRKTNGNWLSSSRNYNIGIAEPRNYVVGLAAVSETEVFAHTSIVGSNIWGDIRFWELNQQSAQHTGNWSGIWRADMDTRMRAFNGKVYFASANSFTSSDIFFSIADGGPKLLQDLKTNVQRHHSGENKKGNPDISIDQSGAAHLVYGADQEVYYNQYQANGRKIYPADQRILNDLGLWHINFGISAIGVSSDGKSILVAGLKTNGHKEATNSKIVLTYSTDRGKTWSEQIETGQITHGGEGRMRPRILAYGKKFVIIYFDVSKYGLSMASIDMDSLKHQNNGSIAPVISTILLLN